MVMSEGERIDQRQWASIDAAFDAAVRAGDPGSLTVLGRGEVSVVIGWPSGEPRWAIKRLPPFPDRPAAARHRELIDHYIAALEDRGLAVVPTEHHIGVRSSGAAVLYCAQPALPSDTLAVDRARSSSIECEVILAGIVDAVMSSVDPQVGLDAQLSNWALVDGSLTYLDVTTPMLRDRDHRSLLDTSVFLATLPAILRGAARRWVVPDLLERYHQPRTVVLDLAANLHKERLADAIPAVIEAAGDRVQPRLDPDEVHRDYRQDARLWAALQQVRRLDAFWRRRVRRRPSAVLLPGPIER